MRYLTFAALLMAAGRFLITPRLTGIPSIEGAYEAAAHIFVGALIGIALYDWREKLAPARLCALLAALLTGMEAIMFVAQRYLLTFAALLLIGLPALAADPNRIADRQVADIQTAIDQCGHGNNGCIEPLQGQQAASRVNALAAAQCPVLSDTGEPQITGAVNVQIVCHMAYAAAVDLDKLVPRWVAYSLTGPHSLGCNQRQDNFHADEQLPKDRRATPADYARSGYDIGHQAAAQDMAWDARAESDSFSLGNMAPQLPHLNRDGWEGLEQAVRDWSLSRGKLVIFVGPVLSDKDASIGPRHVDVPASFYKAVYDPQTGQTLSFIMPQQAIAKGDLAPWQVTLADIEVRAGMTLPIAGDRTAKPTIWPADDAGWHKAHRAACGKD